MVRFVAALSSISEICEQRTTIINSNTMRMRTMKNSGLGLGECVRKITQDEELVGEVQVARGSWGYNFANLSLL